MRFLLEHIKNETVPHDMMEELIAGGVKFYEGYNLGSTFFVSELTRIHQVV